MHTTLPCSIPTPPKIRESIIFYIVLIFTPLDFWSNAGYYASKDGRVGWSRAGGGRWWGNLSGSNNDGYRLGIYLTSHNGVLKSNVLFSYDQRTYGFQIRCVEKISEDYQI